MYEYCYCASFLFVAVTKGLFVLTQTEQICQPAVITASSAS